MTSEIWVTVIGVGGTLLGALGGIWLTSHYENKRRKQELFRDAKKDLYVRILGNIKIIDILMAKEYSTFNEQEIETLFKKLILDIQEVRLITLNKDLLGNLHSIIKKFSNKDKDIEESQIYKDTVSQIRTELGVKDN